MTPEEKRVIEAARAWEDSVRSVPDHGDWIRKAEELRKSVDALRLSEQPKPRWSPYQWKPNEWRVGIYNTTAPIMICRSQAEAQIYADALNKAGV